MPDCYDLVLVGTGFASSFFLRGYLAHAPATARVLVLDRAGLYPHAERVKALRGEPTPFADGVEPSGETFINDTPAKPWHFRTGFGGSSNCWYGCTPRLMPNDFRLRSAYGVGMDWPVTYDELEEYYCRAEELMSISGPAETPFPRSRPYPQPPHVFTTADEILAKKYGALYINQPTARSRIAAAGRNACCGNCVCSVCPVNAKFTIENSNLGVYEDARVTLRADAQVLAVESTGDTVQGVRFIHEGREERVAGALVALGANAIFNAHILANSGDVSPFVGRGLGEQHGMQVTVLLDGLANVGGSTWVNANGYMLYDGEHRRTAAACLIESNNAPYFRTERGRWREIVRFRMIFERLPDDRNMVRLSDDVRRPRVNYSPADAYVQAGVERMRAQLPSLLAVLPVERILFEQDHASEAHIIGTARMSVSAKDGVVDRDLRHHRYRNLFVLGGSAFPTYSPANPTLTISALSLRAADRAFGPAELR